MLSVISGLGYPGRVLISGVYKNIINIFPIIIGFLYGIESFLISKILFGLCGFWVNCFYLRRTIQIPIKEQIEYFLKPMLVGIVLVFVISSFIHNDNIYFSFFVRGILFSVSFLVISLIIDTKLREVVVNEFNTMKVQFISRNKNENVD